MRKKALFFPVLAALMLAGCSNDDVSEVIQDETPKVFTGDEAYISVRLADAGSIYSRATTENPGYEYGSSDEHTVKNAYFYFYDANGVFVSEGNAWDGGNSSVSEEGKAAGNIEFKSNTVVVLKGLTKKNYPKYMVTVLNRPSDFVPDGTLAEMETKLVNESTVGITTQYDGTDHFVMSTTSWTNQTDVQTNYQQGEQRYFVTEVKEGNFLLEPVPANIDENKVVKVYVERLAAKVTLEMGDLPNDKVTLNDGTVLYELKATVGGNANGATGDDNIAAEKLYVKIDGWKLNATAKRSNIVKNIDETWVNTADGSLGFVWNNTNDHRSFWGKSFNYGESDYPENAADAANSEYLNYVNLQDDKTNSPLLGLTESDYCAENTNTQGIVTANFPSCVTSILVKATVCNSKGEALSLVRFNGELFKKTDYIKYILNVMKTKSQWNVWVKTSAEGAQDETFAQLDENYLKVENVGDGKVKVMLDDAKIPATLYTYKPDENDKYDYREVTTDKETFIGNINGDLLAECNSNATSIGYEDGNMYYNIPIEHLNESNKTDDGKYNGIKEANYGVVRNHHYVVTINKLEKIGKGIFNPDEVIVLGKDDDKEAYYVGANINILSWKIVNQSVEL